ncbi:MAG: DUF421 domain-containing protein [Ruminococcaceae bacterium]|nr:DUF421 domain-containing protein [Oscillospiraceae bacterium]
MLISLVRTLILYALVVLSLRVMGKRQIGELQPSELVVAIMISDLASVPMSDSSIPLLYGIVPMLTLVFSEVFLSYLSLKSPIIRQIATGRPTYIINNGKINQKEMKKARYSISDLLEELRMLNVFDIASVHCALLETNGKISVVTTECADDRAYVLVCDGSVQKNVLSSSPFSEKDLKKFLGKKNIKDVFLLSVDSKGKIYCVMKGE